MPIADAHGEQFAEHATVPARAGEFAAWTDDLPNRVLLTTGVPDEKSKARLDVQRTLSDMGYATVPLPAGLRALDWLKLRGQLATHLGEGGHVLVEYPFPGRKRAYMLRLFCMVLGV
jgi:hypothetical protein